MYISSILKVLNRTTYSPLEEGGLGRGADLDALNDLPGDDDKVVPDTDKDDKETDTEDVDSDKDTDTEDQDDDEDKDKDEEEDDKDDDDKDKDDDDKDDEEETEEDKLPSVRDIKKDYPDFFKKHPEVKAAIFRDQRFSEILGSPEEAEGVLERSNTLASVEQDLFVDANPGKLLATIKKNDEGAYKKLVFNIMPYLQEHDKDTYLEIAALPIKQLLRNAWREGEGEKTSLGKAAAWIHQYMFGKDSKFEDKVAVEETRKDEKSQAQKDYEKKLTALEEKEYTNFKTAVDQSYVSKMERFLREDLDKDDRLTNWTRDKIVESTLLEIVNQLGQDTRHNTIMNGLWKQAKASGFNNDFKSRITNTALARAKSLAPNIRAKYVREALGKGKPKDKKDKDEKIVRHQPRSSSERTERRSSSRPDTKKPLTDIDILRS